VSYRPEQIGKHPPVEIRPKVLIQPVRFPAIFHKRIVLSVRPEPDGLRKRLKVLEMRHPEHIKDAEETANRLRILCNVRAPHLKERAEIAFRRLIRQLCFFSRDARFSKLFPELSRRKFAAIPRSAGKAGKEGYMFVRRGEDDVRHEFFVHCAKDLLPPPVNRRALFIQNVIVFQKMLPDIEICTLHLGLRLRNSLRHKSHVNRHIVGNVEPFHKSFDAVAAEDAHEVILKRQKESRRTWITLTPGTPAELVVNPPRFMPLGADYVKPSNIPHGLSLIR
jgi:hypothetical protein